MKPRGGGGLEEPQGGTPPIHEKTSMSQNLGVFRGHFEGLWADLQLGVLNTLLSQIWLRLRTNLKPK